jgi:cell division protein FtsZ
LDEGRALADADAVLVSLMGGKDLTMADVNRVMEQIGRCCERAQIIMGAAVDAEMKNKLSVTLIAARNCVAKNEPPISTADSPEQTVSSGATDRSAGGSPASSDFSHRADKSSAFQLQQREQSVSRHGRARRAGNKLLQTQLPLAIISKGRFDKSEPTIHKGEDLDIPTYVRRGISLN